MIAAHVKRLSPAKVILTTFSLSEASLCEFVDLLGSGQLSDLTIITDFTVRKNKLDVLLFAHENARIFLTDVHAKVALVSNGKDDVVILSTSNLNAIKRYEASVVFYDRPSIDYFRSHLHILLNESVRFEPNSAY